MGHGDGVERGREEENGDVPEDDELTLDAWELAVVKEEVGGGGNRLGGRRPERTKSRTSATGPSFPARFL